MAFEMAGRTLKKIGIVGSGHVGPDIALFFLHQLHPYGVSITVQDIDAAALSRGKQRVDHKIETTAAKSAKPDQIAAQKLAISWTQDVNALADADLVIETATESLAVKTAITAKLAAITRPGTIVLSNSSHFEPNAIFEQVKDKAHVAVSHFFQPADRNMVVELVPTTDTQGSTLTWLADFLEYCGKLPVRLKSRFGFVVNPVFEALVQTAALLVEQGAADVKQVDAISAKRLGLASGVFSMLNQFGATMLVRTGLDGLGRVIHPWFKPPNLLVEMADKQKSQPASETGPWPVAGRDETVTFSETQLVEVGDCLLGAYFAVAGNTLDANLIELGEIDLALEQALSIKGPFTLINEIGAVAAMALIEKFRVRAAAQAFPVPECVRAHAAAKTAFEIPVVVGEVRDDVALVSIRRPKVLNALNDAVFAQLDEMFQGLHRLDTIKAVVLTGFGNRAFVAGADINELAALFNDANPKQAAIEKCRRMQTPLLRIENFGRPVICALNGLALGGGSELAMACTARIARKGIFPCVGQPEPNLGLIPGAGGTQRLPRLVGFDEAWPILRTGKPITDEKALAIGYVEELVDGPNLRARAIQLAREVANGTVKPRRTVTKSPVTPTPSPTLNIGNLSKRIDDLLVKAVVEGATKPLAEALEVEFACFGECFTTQDTKIGLDNFVHNGPKTPARFVHA